MRSHCATLKECSHIGVANGDAFQEHDRVLVRIDKARLEQVNQFDVTETGVVQEHGHLAQEHAPNIRLELLKCRDGSCSYNAVLWQSLVLLKLANGGMGSWTELAIHDAWGMGSDHVEEALQRDDCCQSRLGGLKRGKCAFIGTFVGTVQVSYRYCWRNIAAVEVLSREHLVFLSHNFEVLGGLGILGDLRLAFLEGRHDLGPPAAHGVDVVSHH